MNGTLVIFVSLQKKNPKALHDILTSKNALTKDMNFKITGATKASMVNFGKHWSGIKHLTFCSDLE